MSPFLRIRLDRVYADGIFVLVKGNVNALHAFTGLVEQNAGKRLMFPLRRRRASPPVAGNGDRSRHIVVADIYLTQDAWIGGKGLP